MLCELADIPGEKTFVPFALRSEIIIKKKEKKTIGKLLDEKFKENVFTKK